MIVCRCVCGAFRAALKPFFQTRSQVLISFDPTWAPKPAEPVSRPAALQTRTVDPPSLPRPLMVTSILGRSRISPGGIGGGGRRLRRVLIWSLQRGQRWRVGGEDDEPPPSSPHTPLCGDSSAPSLLYLWGRHKSCRTHERSWVWAHRISLSPLFIRTNTRPDWKINKLQSV